MTQPGPPIVENPENVREAEIIVGIPSYNEADTISVPTDTAARGLELEALFTRADLPV